jgi:hypothetical protein
MSFHIQNTDDISHTAVITYILKKINTLPSASDARVSACNELLTYVAKEALQFTLHHERFKATVIDKCIEFKIEYSDNIHNTHYADLAATCTSLLALLRSPKELAHAHAAAATQAAQQCQHLAAAAVAAEAQAEAAAQAAQQCQHLRAPAPAPAAPTVKHPTPRRSKRLANKQRVVYTR